VFHPNHRTRHTLFVDGRVDGGINLPEFVGIERSLDFGGSGQNQKKAKSDSGQSSIHMTRRILQGPPVEMKVGNDT